MVKPENGHSIAGKPKSRNKKVVIIASSALLVAGLAVALWFSYPLIKRQIDTYSFNSLNDEDKGAQTNEVYLQADRKVAEGSYDEGQGILTKALDIRTSNKDKSVIYQLKSSVALNAEKYDQALEYALKAEELYPNDDTAIVLGGVYEDSGDRINAIKYYELFLSRFEPVSELDQSTIKRVQYTIKDLSQ